MNEHHLILGQLTDFISGRTIDDTLDERYRQKLARLLVEHKGFAKAQIRPNHPLTITVDAKSARLPVTYIIDVDGHAAMLVHYGPGSLVTRHRPALALARLAAPHQIPVVVVTNGEAADVLEGRTGEVIGSGMDGIPDRAGLAARCAAFRFPPVTESRAEIESRILYAYEVDGACPCDDSICRITPEV